MRPLIYLELRQFINGIKNITRSPKRLIPAIIFGVLILSGIMQNLLIMSGAGRRPFPSQFTPPPMIMDGIWAGVFLIVLLVTWSLIANALKDGMLVFPTAAIDFLFPTPVSRRAVLATKLVRDYLKYAVGSAFMIFYMGMSFYASLSADSRPRMLLIWIGVFSYVVFVTNLAHTLNIVTTFGVHRLRLAGRLVKVAMIAVLLLILGLALVHYLRSGETIAGLVAASRSTIVRTLLAPIAWCADILTAPMTGKLDQARAQVLWLLALAGGSTLLLLSRRENIYEPSLGISARAARMKRAVRSGGFTAMMMESLRQKGRRSYRSSPIPPFGRGAWAILWKSLVVRTRMLGWRLVLLGIIPAGVAAFRFAVDEPEILRYMPLGMPLMVAYLALIFQQDLRAELRQANILKAIPASPTTMVTVIVVYQWTLALTVVGLGTLSILLLVPEAVSGILAVGSVAAICVGFLCPAGASIPALLYPASVDWVQDAISGLLTMAIIGGLTVPMLAIAGGLLFVKINLIIVASIIIVVSGVLASCAIAIAGVIFRRFDPTSD